MQDYANWWEVIIAVFWCIKLDSKLVRRLISWCYGDAEFVSLTGCELVLPASKHQMFPTTLRPQGPWATSSHTIFYAILMQLHRQVMYCMVVYFKTWLTRHSHLQDMWAKTKTKANTCYSACNVGLLEWWHRIQTRPEVHFWTSCKKGDINAQLYCTYIYAWTPKTNNVPWLLCLLLLPPGFLCKWN